MKGKKGLLTETNLQVISSSGFELITVITISTVLVIAFIANALYLDRGDR